jgi:hypothetical protein
MVTRSTKAVDTRARLAEAARGLAGTVRVAARDVTRGAASVGATVGRGAKTAVSRAGSTAQLSEATRTTLQSLPKEAVPELAKSVYRLRKVRTPAQAHEAVQTETERLLTVVMPILVEHPLPVQKTTSAKAILAAAGGLAAAGEEIETIAALVSGGSAVPPTLPVVIGANLVALAVELYVAASLRVHDLRANGIEPTAEQVTDDVIFAMTGESSSGRGLGRHVTRHVVRLVATRLLARWSAGLVPFVGIAYMGWDTQRTADAVRALPMPLEVSSRVLDAPRRGLPPTFA